MAQTRPAGRGVAWWLGMAALAVVATWVLVFAFALGTSVGLDNLDDGRPGRALLSLTGGAAGAIVAVTAFMQCRRRGARPGDAVIKALFYGTLASLPIVVLFGPSTVI